MYYRLIAISTLDGTLLHCQEYRDWADVLNVAKEIKAARWDAHLIFVDVLTGVAMGYIYCGDED